MKLKQIFLFIIFLVMSVACSADSARNDVPIELEVINVTVIDDDDVSIKARVSQGNEDYETGTYGLFFFYWSDALQVAATEPGDVLQVECAKEHRCFDPVLIRSATP